LFDIDDNRFSPANCVEIRIFRLAQQRSIMHKTATIAIIALILMAGTVFADNDAPWGRSKLTDTEYKPQKVVYDVTTGKLEVMDHVLDRGSYLSNISGADPFDQSIVLVIHGSAIKFFAIENTARYRAMMQRAESLVSSDVLRIKMCKIAAEALGYRPQDIHGFVEMVPMGDAEIIKLQYEENHAYMR
jgi:intracellular sulfur oxidation DsrE/DsrF family protein